jgi:hypothetical protein
MDKDKETLATLNGKWIELWKDLPPNTQLIVIQNFHFNESAGNEYQGDQITFTENFAAYQLEAPTPTGNILYLENKDATTWTNITDGMSGTLAYNSAGPTFDYTFTGQGLQASTDYCLIYYADTWAGNNPGAFIADMTTDGTGAVTKTGSAALGISLTTLPDPRYPAGAKIWLVPCSDYNSNTRTTGPITTWDPTKFLFENNPILINYKYTP